MVLQLDNTCSSCEESEFIATTATRSSEGEKENLEDTVPHAVESTKAVDEKTSVPAVLARSSQARRFKKIAVK
jgi:hypothetical protein